MESRKPDTITTDGGTSVSNERPPPRRQSRRASSAAASAVIQIHAMCQSRDFDRKSHSADAKVYEFEPRRVGRDITRSVNKEAKPPTELAGAANVYSRISELSTENYRLLVEVQRSSYVITELQASERVLKHQLQMATERNDAITRSFDEMRTCNERMRASMTTGQTDVAARITEFERSNQLSVNEYQHKLQLLATMIVELRSQNAKRQVEVSELQTELAALTSRLGYEPAVRAAMSCKWDNPSVSSINIPSNKKRRRNSK